MNSAGHSFEAPSASPNSLTEQSVTTKNDKLNEHTATRVNTESKLDEQFNKVRTEMIGLRQLDMVILSQLNALQQMINEYKKSVGMLTPNTYSPSNSHRNSPALITNHSNNVRIAPITQNNEDQDDGEIGDDESGDSSPSHSSV